MAEKLYNNIVLPEVWPPRYPDETLKKGQPIPYLENPPEIIDITLGRQLFVDEFLIKGHNCAFKFHRAKKYEGNPVLFPETIIEKYEKLPLASPKGGGVWYDKDTKKYKMWYEAGWLHKNAYAESDDGIHWERPNLHIVEGTNEILVDRKVNTPDDTPGFFRPDSTTVFIDYDTDKSDERYKLFMRNPGGDRMGLVAVSGDGIHFSKAKYTEIQGDRSTMFYNPFRKKWVYSIRCSFNGGRARSYAECDDLLEGAKWGDTKVKWLCADDSIKPNPYIQVAPNLYNFDAVAYESIMLGMYEVYYGPENDVGFKTGAPKMTELIPVFSRDGFHFSKPSNQAVVQASLIEGAWDRGYVQSVGGVCIVLKDEIRIYYSGVAGDESRGGTGNPKDCSNDTMYANGACGFATIRRDGFVSIGTDEDGGVLTRKLTFKGKKKYMFINAQTEQDGVVRAEISDKKKKTIVKSAHFTCDSTCDMLDFGDFDISSLENEEFCIRFGIGKAQLYSFWFSEYENGESGGYDGAGGKRD